MVDKTGFLCDDRLKELLYILDEHEKQNKPSPKEESKSDEISNIEQEKKTQDVKNPKHKSVKETTPKVEEVKESEINLNSSPLDDLDSFDNFTGFTFREPGATTGKSDENSINTDAIFGDFKDEDDIPLMEDLDDIAASILSDIYGGVY